MFKLNKSLFKIKGLSYWWLFFFQFIIGHTICNYVTVWFSIKARNYIEWCAHESPKHDDRVWGMRVLNYMEHMYWRDEFFWYLAERGYWNHRRAYWLHERELESGETTKSFSDWYQDYRQNLVQEARVVTGYDYERDLHIDKDIFFRSNYYEQTINNLTCFIPVIDAFTGKTEWKVNMSILEGADAEEYAEDFEKHFWGHRVQEHPCTCFHCGLEAVERDFSREAYDRRLKWLEELEEKEKKYEEEWKNGGPFIWRESDRDNEENTSTPLDSFLIINDNSNVIFNNLVVDLIVFSFSPIFFLILIMVDIFSTSNLLNLLFIPLLKIFNVFHNIFKNLVTSIRSQRFFSLILSVLVFILFSNLAGFFMLELPLTSHAIITLFLSFIMFFNYSITSLIVNNENFYKHFLIKKLNFLLKLILFVIELVSYIVRPFSLGVRLFSNILSGHILIHIFFGAFLYVYKLSIWVSVIAFVMVLFILTMELFVSFVQSYIFFILNIIYLQDIFIKH